MDSESDFNQNLARIWLRMEFLVWIPDEQSHGFETTASEVSSGLEDALCLVVCRLSVEVPDAELWMKRSRTGRVQKAVCNVYY